MGLDLGSLFGGGDTGGFTGDSIQQQEDASLFNFGLNNPDITNPFGGRRVTELEGGRFNIEDFLSPASQGIFDSGQQFDQSSLDFANRLFASADSTPLNFDDLTPFFESNPEALQDSRDALFGRETFRLDDRFERDRKRNAQRLANQGIQVGSSPFNTSGQLQGQIENDAFGLANFNAEIGAINDLQARQRSQDLSATNQRNDRVFLRNDPILTAQALRRGVGPIQTIFGGGFQPVGGVNAVAAAQLGQSGSQQDFNNTLQLGTGLLGFGSGVLEDSGGVGGLFGGEGGGDAGLFGASA